jgi:hypothetical protein
VRASLGPRERRQARDTCSAEWSGCSFSPLLGMLAISAFQKSGITGVQGGKSPGCAGDITSECPISGSRFARARLTPRLVAANDQSRRLVERCKLRRVLTRPAPRLGGTRTASSADWLRASPARTGSTTVSHAIRPPLRHSALWSPVLIASLIAWSHPEACARLRLPFRSHQYPLEA